MTARREFLKATAAAGGAAFLANAGPLPLLGFEPQKPLDLLILGGTGFIGPHLVRLAVERGHRVTTFTRGRRQAELPDGVTRLIGDRNGQLQALEGGRWDAVIDDSATNPDWVRASTQLLKDSAGAYLFTSSTGAHYPYLKRGLRETDPVRLEITDPKDGSESYGVRKAQCERITLDTFGSRGLVIRPGYIVGPGDTTDRFPYWPVRLAQGGAKLTPFTPEVMQACFKAATDLYADISKTNADFKKIHDAYMNFRGEQYLWWGVAEANFDNFMIRNRSSRG